MPTIRDYVRSNLGETYDKLTDVALYDGQEKPDVVGLKIAALLDRFEVAETDLADFPKSYLGDWATLLLIPIAVDFYMVNTRLVDNASRPSGVTPLGGEVGQNYNRVATLQALAKTLNERLKEALSAFAAALPSGASLLSTGMVTSSHTRTLRTQDPFDTFDKPAGVGAVDPIGYGFANAYVVVVDDLLLETSSAI